MAEPRYHLGERVKGVSLVGPYTVEAVRREVCPCGCGHVYFMYTLKHTRDEHILRDIHERMIQPDSSAAN